MPRAAPFLCLVALLAGAAAAQTPAPAAFPAPALPPGPADWKALDPANTLVIETTKGRIVVELHPELAPNHVARIKALARQGYYNGLPFARVLEFMAQTGAKAVLKPLPNLKNEVDLHPTSAPAYAAFGDAGFVGAVPVKSAPDGGGAGHALFCPGTAAFAHGAQSIDTASSQFFLMKIPGPYLEKQFTVFGRVVQGLEVVAMLNGGQPPPSPDRMTRVRVMADMPAAERPAFKVLDTRSAAFAAMVREAQAAKGAAFTLCDVSVPTQ